MVVIVDPHLKRTDNYPLYTQARDIGALVKRPDGKEDFEGWCWSGSSAWVDFFNPGSWDWWKTLFKVQPQGEQWSWIESTVNTGIWNDMNEVSISNAIPRRTSTQLIILTALGLQRPRCQYAAGKHPLRRLGAP